jgi:release factor glutamine methyltransferase
MATLAEKQAQYLKELSTIYDQGEARAVTLWILEDVLHIKGPKLSLERFMVLTTHQEEVLDGYLQRLVKHEPVQYVLGYAEFFGLKFKVSPAVLIPRPETEELVEIVISAIKKPQSNILDIGTGSGCIPIAIKKNIPDAIATSVDISIEALEIAKSNAEANHTTVDFVHMDILTQMPAGRYDIIVSNPPYIGQEEKNRMDHNVLAHEPHLALFSDEPLLFYRRISEIAPHILAPNGTVYMEVSEYRAREVSDIFLGQCRHTQIIQDMSGKERIVKVTGY